MKASEARHLAEARERIRSAGLNPDAPSDALGAHAAAWGADPALAVALVRVVAECDDPSAGDELLALLPRTGQRELRREIKRALYRLTQRDIWKPPSTAAPPPTATLVGTVRDEPQAWVSSIDPTGTRLLWLARRTIDGVASLSAIASEDSGLRELHAGLTTRKALREAQRELTSRSGISLVEAPWEHVYRLVRDAFEATTDRSRLGDVLGALQRIAPQAPSLVAPPVDALLDRAAVADDERALADSAHALEEAELRSWLLPLDWVEAAAEQVRKASSSPVILTPAQQRERIGEALARATEELFAPAARRNRFAARLEETAYLWARRGQGEAARKLLAAAIAARSTRRIAEIPLLIELARRSLGLALEVQARREREEASTSLVLTPAQALTEERRRRSRR